MREFNYYGQMGADEEIDEEDVQKLEKEIEEMLRNRRIGVESSKGHTVNI